MNPPNGTTERAPTADIVGGSAVMREIVNKITKMAASDANVMIYGESGTGKEVIARCIHKTSQRRDQPLVPVDCVGIPEALLESELFGYEKDAFTDAASLRWGLLECADHGTLVLDDIAELAPGLQAKLLRVLQEGEFRRLGGKEWKKVDVRIVSATNVKPQRAIEDGSLRHDLYYRLNVIALEVPPLRERREDIPVLVEHFLEKLAKMSPEGRKTIEPEAVLELQEYSWPGNVRELQNLLERLVSVVADRTIRASDLPQRVRSATSKSLAEKAMAQAFREARQQASKDFEREYLVDVITKCNGNIVRAAREVGVSRTTIYRRINRYHINKQLSISE